MKERNLSNLNSRDIEKIEAWLVGGYPCPKLNCNRCNDLFPGAELHCPCNVYGKKYVIKVAKQIVHKWKYDW